MAQNLNIMENTKNEKKPTQRPKTKLRKKPLDAKNFIKTTSLTILNRFDPNEQNIIVKELYFAVRDNRQRLINEQREYADILAKLNEEISIQKS